MKDEKVFAIITINYPDLFQGQIYLTNEETLNLVNIILNAIKDKIKQKENNIDVCKWMIPDSVL